MIKYVILNLEPSNDKIQCSLQIKYLSTNPLRAVIWTIQRFYNFFYGEKFKLDYPTELINKYNNWNSQYKQFQKLGLNPSSANEDLDKCAKQLDRNLEQFNQELNNWLKSVPNKVEEKIEKNFLSSLEKFLDSDTKVIFVIETEILEIQKLFWHHWKLLKKHPQISLVFGITRPKNKVKQELYVRPFNEALKVLIIFGDIPEGNIQKQKNIWEKSISICHNLGIKLELHYLEKISSQKIRSLVDNGHQFEVIYFLGHNPYEEEGNGQEDNNIQISEYEYWTNSKFCECINIQRIKTLKLVILDSCYSLKLAKALINEAEIPQVIAMRESIFLDFSREFLVVLLIDLLRYKFLPFAIKEAQEKIEDNEDDKKWQSSASVVALLQNLNKTPWTWPNNKESRFKNTILIGGLGFLFGFVIGLIYMPIISPLAKSIFMNIPIIRRLFPPLATDVKNLLAESTVTIKTYDPISKATSYFYGVIVAADKDIKKFSKDNKIYHVLTQAKLLEKGNKDNVYTIFTEQGPENSSQSYPPSNIKEISQDLAIVSFESNKEYKIAQLSATKAELDKTIIIGFRESPEATKQFNYFHSTIADTEPSPNNKIYTFFYNSIGNTQKIQTEANSIFDKHGCFIGIDLGKLNPYNRGIGISGEAILDLRKIQRLTSNIKSGTESTESVKKPYENLYTESCQYE